MGFDARSLRDGSHLGNNEKKTTKNVERDVFSL